MRGIPIIRNKEQRKKTLNHIGTKNARKLNRLEYQKFKDTANLLLKYETEEDMYGKKEIIIREHTCPAAQRNCRKKEQITYRREEVYDANQNTGERK